MYVSVAVAVAVAACVCGVVYSLYPFNPTAVHFAVVKLWMQMETNIYIYYLIRSLLRVIWISFRRLSPSNKALIKRIE